MKNKKETYSFQNLEEVKLAWLAGLFQAEAHFSVDKRVRSKTNSLDYTPPPPIVIIKLEMIEKDLMEKVGEYVDEKVVVQKRKTKANNTVYRVTIQQRKKTEVFLKSILPYVVGEKTRLKIEELLKICDLYNEWLTAGGKNAQAKLAAQVKKSYLNLDIEQNLE